jgi:hypothetical protein
MYTEARRKLHKIGKVCILILGGGMFFGLLSSMVLEQDRTEIKRVPSEAKK